MPDLHHTLLEDYFFAHIDRGVNAEATPLLSGSLGERELVLILAERFQISLSEAASAVEPAKMEVRL